MDDDRHEPATENHPDPGNVASGEAVVHVDNGDLVSEAHSDDVSVDDNDPNDILAINELLRDAREQAKELVGPNSISFLPADWLMDISAEGTLETKLHDWQRQWLQATGVALERLIVPMLFRQHWSIIAIQPSVAEITVFDSHLNTDPEREAALGEEVLLHDFGAVAL
jgi:hypothetical protein